jgi:uncharacterized protein
MTETLLFDGPDGGSPILVLAHGAGAPMDSPFMTGVTERLAAMGHRVARFEFPYMARRRAEGTRRPPDRQPILLDSWRKVIGHLGGAENVVIGGKSMGGRMASLIAAEMPVRGLLCLGYPFHPPGKPEKTRTEHLAALDVPGLILQGTRDPFGRPDEIAAYRLSDRTTVHWIEDGDHDLKPRKSSGRDHAAALDEIAEVASGFLRSLAL